MKNTNCSNVPQWYTKIKNLARLAGIKDIQNDYQVKVVLINGIRPASLFKDVSAEIDVDDVKRLDSLSLIKIYTFILQKEKVAVKTDKVVKEENNGAHNGDDKPNNKNKKNNKKDNNDNKNKNRDKNKKNKNNKTKDNPYPEKNNIDKLMPLTIDELREQNRCFYCTKELGKGKHAVHTCKRAYGELNWDKVRKQYLEGKSFEEITKSPKKESGTSSDSTPKNPKVGLGDGQKK